jgi:hypothetical protein
MYEPVLWYDFSELIQGTISITDKSNNGHNGSISGNYAVGDGFIIPNQDMVISHDNFLFNTINQPWSISLHCLINTLPNDKPILDIFDGIYLSLLDRGVININKFFFAEFAYINSKIITLCYDGVASFKIFVDGFKLPININDSEINLNGLIINPSVKLMNLGSGNLFSYKLYDSYLPDYIIVGEHKGIIVQNNFVEPTELGTEKLFLSDELKGMIDNIKSSFNDTYISRHNAQYLPKLATTFIRLGDEFKYEGKKYKTTKPYLYTVENTALFKKEDKISKFRKTHQELLNLGVKLADILVISDGEIFPMSNANLIFTYDGKYLYVESDIKMDQWLLFYNKNFSLSNIIEPNSIKVGSKYLVLNDITVREIHSDVYMMEKYDNIEENSFYYLNPTTGIFEYAKPEKFQSGINVFFKFFKVGDTILLLTPKYPEVSNVNKKFDLLNIPQIRLPNMNYINSDGTKINIPLSELDKSKRELWFIHHILKSNLRLLEDYQLEDVNVKYSRVSGNRIKTLAKNNKYTFIPPIVKDKKSYVLVFRNGLYDTSIIKDKNKFIIDTTTVNLSDNFDIMTFEYLDTRRTSIIYDHSIGINKTLLDGKIRIFARSDRTGVYNRTLDYHLFEIFYDDSNVDKIFLSPLYDGDEIIITTDRYFNHHQFTIDSNDSCVLTWNSDEHLGHKLKTLLFINGVWIPHSQYEITNPTDYNLTTRSYLTIYGFPKSTTGIFKIDLFCTPVSFIPLVENETLDVNNLLYTRSSLFTLPFNIQKNIIFADGKIISEELVTHISSDIIHIDNNDTNNLFMIGIDYDRDEFITNLSEIIDNIWDTTVRTYSENDIMTIFNLKYKPDINKEGILYKLNKRLVDLANVFKFGLRNMTGTINVGEIQQLPGFNYAKTAKGELYLDSNLDLYEDPQIPNYATESEV